MPLASAAAGDVDVRLDDVDVQALARDLPAVPLRLQGRASGSVKATLPPAGADGERQATGKIDLTAKSLRVQNIPTENLHADVAYLDGVASYSLKGDSLGGRFTLDGKVPLRDAKKAPPIDDAPSGGDKPEASTWAIPIREHSTIAFVGRAGTRRQPWNGSRPGHHRPAVSTGGIGTGGRRKRAFDGPQSPYGRRAPYGESDRRCAAVRSNRGNPQPERDRGRRGVPRRRIVQLSLPRSEPLQLASGAHGRRPVAGGLSGRRPGGRGQGRSCAATSAGSGAASARRS